MHSDSSALEAEQQRARIPKDVLALLEGNRVAVAEKGDEANAGQEEEREERERERR